MAEQRGYQGNTAAVMCGRGGLMANLNPSQITLKNVIQAEGAVFRQDHWRKEPGTALFGSILTPAADPDDNLIVALNDWHPEEAIQRVVALRGDGHLYITDNGATNPEANVSVTTSGPGTRFGFFVTGGQETGSATRKLFVFRQNFNVTYLDGDVTNDIALPLPALDWSDAHPPITGIINGGGSGVAGGRLVAAGNTNNPHMLYASVFGDQTDFQTSGGVATDFQTLPVFPGVGERIYALRNYQGFIVVFKYPRGVFLADMRDTDPANWLVQQVTDVVGVAPSPYAALQLENDVLFLGSDGQFYLFSAVLAAALGQQNMETANLGMDLEIYEFLLNVYDRQLLNQLTSVYQPFWQTATFSVAIPGNPHNSARLLFDFTAVGRKGGDPRFSYSYRDEAAALCLWRDPNDFIDKPLFGDYDGNIIKLEQDLRTTWNGASYPWRVQTPFSNFGEFENLQADHFVQFANHNKIWDALELEYLAFTDATLTLSFYVDGIFRDTINVPLTLGGDPLAFTPADTDAFVIGTSALSGGALPRAVVRWLQIGAGRRLSVVFENNNYGEDVALTHLFFYFKIGDQIQMPRGANA